MLPSWTALPALAQICRHARHLASCARPSHPHRPSPDVRDRQASRSDRLQRHVRERSDAPPHEFARALCGVAPWCAHWHRGGACGREAACGARGRRREMPERPRGLRGHLRTGGMSWRAAYVAARTSKEAGRCCPDTAYPRRAAECPCADAALLAAALASRSLREP